MLSEMFQIGFISRFGSNFNLALFGNCGNTLSGNTNTGKAFLQLRKPLKRFCNLFGEVWLRLWTALAVDSTVLERMLEPEATVSGVGECTESCLEFTRAFARVRCYSETSSQTQKTVNENKNNALVFPVVFTLA